MLPYKNLILLKSDSKQAIYLQIVEQIIQLIQKGQLKSESRLPSSRAMAKMLDLNRNTIIAAYEELEAQGWVEFRDRAGTFVHRNIPILQSQHLDQFNLPQKNGLDLIPKQKLEFIGLPTSIPKGVLKLDDGVPDVRLAPLDALARSYRAVLKHRNFIDFLGYQDVLGEKSLRQELIKYLEQTRGLSLGLNQIIITRGSIMGIYLAANAILQQGDSVVVGETNYQTANLIFQHLGAKLQQIPVDEKGLCIDVLEQHPNPKKIKAIYVASHHHHPTTVSLSAERRVQLLALANKYQWAIIEDDYDYDFHYRRNPILPLASIDRQKQVFYIGSLSKVLAPAFRVGFVVANAKMIEQLGRLRRIIDRQGDTILEKAIANLFKLGEIQGYIRKSLQIYHKRRDYFTQLLREHLTDYIQFQEPNGGLALWAKFHSAISLRTLAQIALKKGLYIADGSKYAPNANATRLGFASSNEDELKQAVLILKESINESS